MKLSICGFVFTLVLIATIILPSDGKGLPSIDTPRLKWMIEHDQIYVDKTKYLYLMLEEKPKHKYFSLGIHYECPGFGKSLLIDTMNEFFRGEKKLFKNTYIGKEHANYSWTSYPIIKLDFSELDFFSVDTLRVGILDRLIIIANSHNLRSMKKDMPLTEALPTLIQTLKKSTGLGVVILIDIPVIGSTDMTFAHILQTILVEFSTILKAQNDDIHFGFFTLRKEYIPREFSNLPIFNLAVESKYHGIVGFTREEVNEYFGSHIQAVAHKRNETSVEHILQKYIKWDWYTFETTHVCNPCSLIGYLTY